jgi:hypothetical protein
MVDISLNCRLFRDVDYEFIIVANTTNSIGNFKKKIRENIKGTGNNIFDDIEADHLILWQVCINKEEFSNLTLNTTNENVKKLKRGLIGDYWAVQPPKEFIHVIVDSPYLTALQSMSISSLVDHFFLIK